MVRDKRNKNIHLTAYNRCFYWPCGALIGIVGIWPVTVLMFLLEVITVSTKEVNMKIIAIAIVTFLMKAMPVGALKSWSDPPPPNKPEMPDPLPACKSTMSIRLTQASM
ncbi:MAG: hypothetical protein A2204_01780 [Elusimicrobia bacterium RIFOXYA1_FULL_47_7]|nr:MAG: hypothetical protein A2204_01780 [Elusimicrobia bacterium RIFOXYA1_FULL_47_7]OGS11741.1 MAG: hypothetical protein A2386_01625 [Elusimicrobia bacterium RIFOXYB1_FULL_48_9]OGS16741.1 MAG: hypothetical protein A2251_05040 [Elusimicrobia bacterium RIFOXYA2_FULL_47_53]OGS27022.1 MAG: hypothetical protein A2339_04895 [Elusimicrobia bacterium RIFOXYB12_FULL_50_12]OGS31969.1 MAG: hypothetical protein A2323_07815 [Elusimicrobia bacterium RIFOXYB2_FULL_46_23]